MGQKVNSNGLRYGINKNWQSRWVPRTNAQAGDWLVQDEKIRKYLFKKYPDANISHIEIERSQSHIEVFIYAAQQILIVGTNQKNLDVIKKDINKIVGRQIKVDITVSEVGNPALSARLIAREIADSIEHRSPLRSAMRMALRKVLKSNGKGIKVLVSGRLNGVEIARDKMYIEGNMPLSTLRADIDYALEEAHMSYGVIGVKVWINRGQLFTKDLNRKPAHLARPTGARHHANDRHDRPGRKQPANTNTERTHVIESSDLLASSVVAKDLKEAKE
ncbi:30S ribosomal protein S3 [[Mycoplasma] testudinis]|uniref:30S ribosomal protein S3 n=1 Tax=[Mycoplasma] testudinis TaxID=33924 RepID=UPI000485362F|nr:30S ribosomal protein S3 [[Mycoplasma] testudinis]